MSFKIRMKMFIAESRTCVSAESCGKGTALSQPFGFIFAHSLFTCRWCCVTGPWSGLRLPGWGWKDGAAACVWTPLPRVSARTCHRWGVPVGVRAGGCDCVCVPVPLYASSQVCVAGVGLRVSFSACITALRGLSTCETGCDSLSVCVSFCVALVPLGGGHGCGGVWVWACFSVALRVFFYLCADGCEHLGGAHGCVTVGLCGSVCIHTAVCVHV